MLQVNDIPATALHGVWLQIRSKSFAFILADYAYTIPSCLLLTKLKVHGWMSATLGIIILQNISLFKYEEALPSLLLKTHEYNIHHTNLVPSSFEVFVMSYMFGWMPLQHEIWRVSEHPFRLTGARPASLLSLYRVHIEHQKAKAHEPAPLWHMARHTGVNARQDIHAYIPTTDVLPALVLLMFTVMFAWQTHRPNPLHYGLLHCRGMKEVLPIASHGYRCVVRP